MYRCGPGIPFICPISLHLSHVSDLHLSVDYFLPDAVNLNQYRSTAENNPWLQFVPISILIHMESIKARVTQHCITIVFVHQKGRNSLMQDDGALILGPQLLVHLVHVIKSAKFLINQSNI